ncbi:hypothetical protein BKA65DRAFT_574421 [Rhexocercosporidium sp. MPI-PUGE-AT-0058]|nr:hypothetical protein BKA65DRAFT_574421 [Rhexocercosporidium sp. MPI-PUGE-AT-0058]
MFRLPLLFLTSLLLPLTLSAPSPSLETRQGTGCFCGVITGLSCGSRTSTGLSLSGDCATGTLYSCAESYDNAVVVHCAAVNKQEEVTLNFEDQRPIMSRLTKITSSAYRNIYAAIYVPLIMPRWLQSQLPFMSTFKSRDLITQPVRFINITQIELQTICLNMDLSWPRQRPPVTRAWIRIQGYPMKRPIEATGKQYQDYEHKAVAYLYSLEYDSVISQTLTYTNPRTTAITSLLYETEITMKREMRENTNNYREQNRTEDDFLLEGVLLAIRTSLVGYFSR